MTGIASRAQLRMSFLRHALFTVPGLLLHFILRKRSIEEAVRACLAGPVFRGSEISWGAAE